MKRRKGMLPGLMLLLAFVTLFTGCSSGKVTFEDAMELYNQAKYAEAAEAFDKLKDNAQAQEYLKKCKLYAEYQSEKKVRELTDSWVKQAEHTDSFKGQTFTAIDPYGDKKTEKKKVSTKDDPAACFDFLIGEVKKKGDLELLAVMFPYLDDALRSSGSLLSISAASKNGAPDDYFAELLAMKEFYDANPDLAKVCCKNDGLLIRTEPGKLSGTRLPYNKNFAEWISDETNAAVLELLKPVVKGKYTVSTDAMIWDDTSLYDYFYTRNYRAADPKKNTYTIIYDPSSKVEKTVRDGSNTTIGDLPGVIEEINAATDYEAIGDPKLAEVYIYYTLKYKKVDYEATDGNGKLTVYAGTRKFKAVDAVTGEKIAEFSVSVKTNKTETRTGGEHTEYRKPSLLSEDNKAELNSFFDEIKAHFAR